MPQDPDSEEATLFVLKELSIDLFLGLVTEYVGHDSLRIHFIPDNLGLINRSRDHLTYTISYVNTTVQAEHDSIEQIHRTNKTNKIKATFEHVHGHQDDKIAKEDLPLPAQLNVECDELVGDDRRDYGIFRTKVPLTSACPAHLHIQGITVTSNMRHQLIRAFIEPRYMQYL